MYNTLYLTNTSRVKRATRPSLLAVLNIGNLKISLRLKIIRFVGLFSSITLIAFCIFQINTYTRAYYSIQGAQARINQLTKENRDLQISFSNINSLNNIEEHIKNFEAIDTIEYIKILDRTVLAK